MPPKKENFTTGFYNLIFLFQTSNIPDLPLNASSCNTTELEKILVLKIASQKVRLQIEMILFVINKTVVLTVAYLYNYIARVTSNYSSKEWTGFQLYF